MLDRLQNAHDIIKKGKEIAAYYKDEYLKAKLTLIDVSRLIKLNQNYGQTSNKIGEAYSYFHGKNILDGEADCSFLRGVQLLHAAYIKSCQNDELSVNSY